MKNDCKYILYDRRWLPEIQLIYPRFYTSYKAACIARSRAVNAGKCKLTDVHLSEVTNLLQNALEDQWNSVFRPLCVAGGVEVGTFDNIKMENKH